MSVEILGVGRWPRCVKVSGCVHRQTDGIVLFIFFKGRREEELLAPEVVQDLDRQSQFGKIDYDIFTRRATASSRKRIQFAINEKALNGSTLPERAKFRH